MKKFFLLFIALIFIFSGCGKSKFESYMDKGKELLRDGKYDEAKSYFDNALIEKPNDKDAKALYDRAGKSLEDLKSKENEEDVKRHIDQYIESRKVIFVKVSQIANSIDEQNINNLGLYSLNNYLDECKELDDKLMAIQNKNIDDSISQYVEQKFSELDNHLSSSISNISFGVNRELSNDNSKYNGTFVQFAKTDLEDWTKETNYYKQ
ncbi:hypothetical protein [Cohnella sp. AR92]|uniref:hypothetical protein n=1 Tax=Cohnella sp. AR92 TaxID=648716 RepID=UPI000F8F79BC|nr:hypothetical protein [Cohnella sp. AR92]RUS44918.1 hypothetical protein ELR57_21930 [Cohnella sp. AR92]